MRNGLQGREKPDGRRKQTDNLQAIGFDGYNATLTGNKSATLGINCGMTTGRNGVLVKAIGFDVYNMAQTGGVSKTLNSIRSDADHVPVVFVLNEQGKKGDSITVEKTNALLKYPKRQPVICLNDQGGTYSVDEKMGNTYIWEEQANTLASRDYKQPQAVMVRK